MTERKELRPINSVGMFDLFKGVFMVLIIIIHTVTLFDGNSLGIMTFVFRNSSAMAAFFMTNGFGFRKCPAVKCIRQQRKTLLVPYICTGIAATIFHCAVHYACFHLKHSSVVESLRITAGFALGLARTAEYFGQTVFACGIWWFPLTMAGGLVMLSLLLKLPDEKKQWTAALAVMLAGWGLCCVRRFEIPWCISRAMAMLPYIYVGYLAKRKKWLEQSLPIWYIVLLIICVLFNTVFASVCKVFTDISFGVWAAGPLSIVTDGIIGYFVIWVFVRLGRYSGTIVRFFETIGARSLDIICVHTVEWYAPWYLLPQVFAGRQIAGLAVALLMRLSFIFLGCLLLALIKKKLATARTGKNAVV